MAQMSFISLFFKPYCHRLNRKKLYEGMRASLERLNLDYVDVVFAHKMDPHTPMEEIVRGFNQLINDNKAFYWCTSEWTAAAIEEAHVVSNRLGLIAPICEVSRVINVYFLLLCRMCVSVCLSLCVCVCTCVGYFII